MLLRTRLTLYLSLVFLLIVVGLSLASLRRESILEDQLASLAISGQEALWESIVTETSLDLEGLGARMIGQMERRPPPESPEAIRRWFEQAGNSLMDRDTVLQVTDTSGRLIFSSEGTLSEDPLLDAATLDSVVASSRPAGGLQQATRDSFMVLKAVPLIARAHTFGVIILGRNVQNDLHRFATEIQATAFLLNLRGRMVQGTSPLLWQRLEPEVPPRDTHFSTIASDSRRFTVTSIPLADGSDRLAGTLVSLRDSTAELSQQRTLGLISISLVGGFVILVLVALYLYLRHAFRPLEEAIGVLRALSKGDTAVTLRSEGEGEIGRIADAISVFRANTMTLDQQRRQAARHRRRQERLIKKQLTVLASSLAGEGKDEALEDMRSLLDASNRKPADKDKETALNDDAELGLLAQVLQSMSSRITDQHQELTSMVAELREAIVTRTKLAGLQQELEIARRLQRSILPTALPPSSSVQVAGRMEAAKEVGGDFYDFFYIEPTKLGLVIADVSGKGIPAALFMAISRSLLKATAQSVKEPGAAIDNINAVLADGNEEMMFVTLFYAVLDLTDGSLTYVNAGHNPPYIHKPDGQVLPLGGIGDIPVAVMEDFSFAEQGHRLSPGDTLLLYTDGITEAFDAADQPYGEPRLEAALAAVPQGAGPAETVVAIERSVAAFVSGAPQSDDLTMLAVTWKGPLTP
ncbi:MAG: PP2C family protein-serine/threonine phosphatase [Pseudomonadota bacterium]